MLALSRKKQEKIVITVPPSDKTQVITIVNLGLKNRTKESFKIGIETENKEIKILRSELINPELPSF